MKKEERLSNDLVQTVGRVLYEQKAKRDSLDAAANPQAGIAPSVSSEPRRSAVGISWERPEYVSATGVRQVPFPVPINNGPTKQPNPYNEQVVGGIQPQTDFRNPTQGIMDVANTLPASGITPKVTAALAGASRDAAAQREALYQSESARAKKMYGGIGEAGGAGPKYGGDVYENVDLKGGTATIYGNKPASPYAGLSPESQALIKRMDESVGNRDITANYANTVAGLIKAEKGEIGATERTKLGLAPHEKTSDIEERKLNFEMQKDIRNRDMNDPRNIFDIMAKYAKTTEVSVEDPNNPGVTTKQIVNDTTGVESMLRRIYPKETEKALGPEKKIRLTKAQLAQELKSRGITDPKDIQRYEDKYRSEGYISD